MIPSRETGIDLARVPPLRGPTRQRSARKKNRATPVGMTGEERSGPPRKDGPYIRGRDGAATFWSAAARRRFYG